LCPKTYQEFFNNIIQFFVVLLISFFAMIRKFHKLLLSIQFQKRKEITDHV